MLYVVSHRYNLFLMTIIPGLTLVLFILSLFTQDLTVWWTIYIYFYNILKSEGRRHKVAVLSFLYNI